MAIKRLHYYDQQFLVESDFTDEQKYHLEMRRRLSRVLHTFGIGEGLDVQRTGSRQVTVNAGTAIDSGGRELVLEANQVVDLTNLTTFPGGATIFITMAYQEAQTDPSTATGVPGNTRFSEAPVVLATTTAPPADGTVILLARFVKTTSGDVPGNPGDLLDGGVRQSASAKIAPGAVAEVNLNPALAAKVNAPGGVIAVDGVTNPAGNIDLIQSNAITLTPNNTAKTITIGENHSAINGNPHNTSASQLLGYDWRLRALVAIVFNNNDASGAQRTVTSGAFGNSPARIVTAISNVSCFMTNRMYGGGSFGFFDAALGVQRCFGVGVTANSATDWFMRSQGPDFNGVCSAHFVDSTVSPIRIEQLTVTVAPTAGGLIATLTRTGQNPFPANTTGFSLITHFFFTGA